MLRKILSVAVIVLLILNFAGVIYSLITANNQLFATLTVSMIVLFIVGYVVIRAAREHEKREREEAEKPEKKD